MSEIKLNLIDSTTILTGTIHASVGDRLVASLAAEPETIGELITALERFEKDPADPRLFFSVSSEPDFEPFDAGILIIDMAGRLVACESTYSIPEAKGYVHYHDGRQSTDIPICYHVAEDWCFLNSIHDYEAVCVERRLKRKEVEPLDARLILYGRPLLDFLATNILYMAASLKDTSVETENLDESEDSGILSLAGAIHAQWLLTPRQDLRGQSPRDVMLAKQGFLTCDLESRALQWSLQLEGPPCLRSDSFAYRFGGFGFHEWVIYYELIRHLLNSTLTTVTDQDFETLVTQLESLQNNWLNEPNETLSGRIPAIVVENERKRLPEAMGGRSMVVDEDCPICKAMGDDCESGRDVCFWHLDGSSMEDHFAFSTFASEQEYLEYVVERDLLHHEFDKQWKEREERIARGEEVEFDPLFNGSNFDEFVPVILKEAEPPEA